MRMLNFIKIAMVTPTKEGICAPSRRETEVTEMDMREFMEKYADSARGIQVSRSQDGKSNPTTETAYGHGLNCRLVEATEKEVANKITGGKNDKSNENLGKARESTEAKNLSGWSEDGSYTTPGGITYTSEEMYNAAYSGADFST